MERREAEESGAGGNMSKVEEKKWSRRADDGGENKENLSKEKFDLAGVYVSDAQYNRNIPFDPSPQAVRLYLLYNHGLLHVLVYVFIMVDLALALFEEPAVVSLPLWATSAMELVCLLAITLRVIHYSKVIPRRIFFRDPKNLCIIVIITLFLIDMIIYGALYASGHSSVRWSRVLRPLLLVNVTEGQQLRRAFRSIRNALPQILVVFCLFIFSLLIFSLMALKLLGKRNLKTIDGTSYFTNYLESVFELYVLLTTANSPDVMMPAYNYSSYFAIFFILYIVINTYTFMSVFLAVVYNNYKKHLKEEVRQLVKTKRQKLRRAFCLLKENVGTVGNEGTGGTGEIGTNPVVSQSRWTELVKQVQPNISTAHRELLWSVLDHNNKGHIGKQAFLQIADLLNIQVITLKSRPHPFQLWMPALYNSTVSRIIHRIVKHRVFVFVYDAVILVNAVFIGLDEEDPLVSNAEWAFLTLYLLEILLKLYTFEPRAFFARHQFWNWFDTIIILSALLATIINAALKSYSFLLGPQLILLDVVRLSWRYADITLDTVALDTSQKLAVLVTDAPARHAPTICPLLNSAGGYTSRQILDIVFILRVLRLIRVVDTIPSFRAIIDTLTRIGPPMLTFGQLILVVYYIFAMVGMELFKGKIQVFAANSTDPAREYCGNPLLKDSAFARNNYCKNNFNDVVSSFILLLELTVVNQWHVLTGGFTAVTHNAARIFFVLFHIVVVIIIINIFVAFILEAFFIEYMVEKTDLHTSLEKKIEELNLCVEQEQMNGNLVEAMETQENDMGSSEGAKTRPTLMFKISSKRYRTMDALLQRMFETETDLSADDMNEDAEDMNFSNPSFNPA
ncbi:two pore segment channel 3 isoform X1 [Astyanax mexicanus]|uniref:two pore segment channel 3 isoform X1 n=1 Tax=Astyanax mexicanus TaxID=7994 RepID=UPI0020CB32DF|nr:two pore segment channel 3 isoform X1 [Astyanax mexicanus]